MDFQARIGELTREIGRTKDAGEKKTLIRDICACGKRMR